MPSPRATVYYLRVAFGPFVATDIRPLSVSFVRPVVNRVPRLLVLLSTSMQASTDQALILQLKSTMTLQ